MKNRHTSTKTTTTRQKTKQKDKQTNRKRRYTRRVVTTRPLSPSLALSRLLSCFLSSHKYSVSFLSVLSWPALRRSSVSCRPQSTNPPTFPLSLLSLPQSSLWRRPLVIDNQGPSYLVALPPGILSRRRQKEKFMPFFIFFYFSLTVDRDNEEK